MINIDKCRQLKLFLKEEAQRLDLSVGNTYSTFFLRMLLENISKRNLDGSIITKGSFAQFVYLGRLVRPIVDLDLTSLEAYDEVILTIMAALDDPTRIEGLEYGLRRNIYQTPNGIYKIKLHARYGMIEHCISMDYKEQHPCIYEKKVMTVPTLFHGDSQYEIVVPSLEETLAEKLCIIVETNKAATYNNRIKDFYDAYQLFGGSYDEDKFSYYFEKMLGKRDKVDPAKMSSSHLGDDFVERHQVIWNNTSRNMEFFDREIDFGELVFYISAVLDQQSDRIRKGKNRVYACTHSKKYHE